MKKTLALLCIIVLASCAELQQIAGQLPPVGVSDLEIAQGLRQALDQGIEKQVNKLTKKGWFLQE